MYDDASLQFDAVFIDATEVVSAVFHVDRHLVVEGRFTKICVVQAPEYGLLRVAMCYLKHYLLAVAAYADGYGDLGVVFRVDERHHVVGVHSATSWIECWQWSVQR